MAFEAGKHGGIMIGRGLKRAAGGLFHAARKAAAGAWSLTGKMFGWVDNPSRKWGMVGICFLLGIVAIWIAGESGESPFLVGGGLILGGLLCIAGLLFLPAVVLFLLGLVLGIVGGVLGLFGG